MLGLWDNEGMTAGGHDSGDRSGDEMVDIVDEHDQVVDTVTRREMRAGNLRHRAVFIAVQGTDGRLFVHQRSFDKDVRPGAWDIAVGGVVGAGESYDHAAVRELEEEIGITGVTPQPWGGGLFGDEHYELVGRCYHVVHDGPFTFNDGEVIGYRWVNRVELQALIRDDEVAEDSVALLLDRLVVAD
ncbi:MAG: hydrolase [Ilumatobacteraceae bacterium]|nr:hydrolase [Ilumatobacteraceae bacterium]